MINEERFNKGLLRIIKTCSYEMYIINRNLDIRCTCVSHATKQADTNCSKCLGTGYKITIKKIRAAAQDSQLPATFRGGNFLIARNYYIPSNERLIEEDLIVDNDSVYMVFEYQENISISGTIPYRKISATKKKFDTKTFFTNFNKIIARR